MGSTSFDTELTSFCEPLRRITDLRCRAKTLNATLGEATKDTLKLLFTLTLIAAATLHVFTHWQRHHKPTAPAVAGQEASTQVASEAPSLEFVRNVAGGLSLILATWGLIAFAVERSRGTAEQAHDSRALAEGLRVQIAWNLAGLGESVSANYMQRQRSELDWIRGAIRSVAFPYELWKTKFDALQPKHQLRALRCVGCGWIEEQASYFQKAASRHQHALHLWHKLGTVAALSSVFTFALLWLSEVAHEVHDWLEHVPLPIIAAGLLAIGVVVSAIRKVVIQRSATAHAESHSQTPHARVHQILDWLVPAPEPHPTSPVSTLRHFGRLLLGYLSRLPLSVATALMVIWISSTLAHWSANFPDGHSLSVILSGILLLSGALAVAWAEKNLLSEFAYQYSTMSALFDSAHRHFQRDLVRLQQLHNQAQAATAAGNATEATSKQAEFQQQLRDIQVFLLALGQEALDENAEWLILHRARPLEPVMAG